MNVHIAFATNSGSTQQAAQITSDILTKHGHTVTLKLAKETTTEEATKTDLLVLASPSWDYDNKEGQPHEDFFIFFKTLEGTQLKDKPMAVLGLGDSSYSIFCGAVTHLEEFVKQKEGKLIVPSLKIDGFFYNMNKATEDTTAWAENLATTLQK